MRILFAVVASFLPLVAQARPVAKSLDLKVGKEEFFHAWVKAVVVDDPSIATAELLPSQEVLLTPLKPGRATLLVVGETSLEAVRLRVYAEGSAVVPVRATEEQRAAARKACPGLTETGKEGEKTVSAAVSSAACRSALLALFAADEYSARRVELQFTPETIQDQLAVMRQALKSKGLEAVQAGYSGTTLTLKGSVSEAQHLEALKTIFDIAIGAVAVEDTTEIVEEKKPAKDGEKPKLLGK
jgi:hypothetical protein